MNLTNQLRQALREQEPAPGPDKLDQLADLVGRQLENVQAEQASALSQLVEYLHQELAPAVRPVPPAQLSTRSVQLADGAWNGATSLPWRPLLSLDPSRAGALLSFWSLTQGAPTVYAVTASEQVAQGPLDFDDSRVVILPPISGSVPAPVRIEGGGRLWVTLFPIGVPSLAFAGAINEIV